MRTLLLLTLPLALLTACLTPRAIEEAEHSRSLGLAYLSEGNNGDAIGQLKASVKKNKWDPEAWHGLGLAYFGAESHDLAEESLLKAIDLKEGFSQAHVNLGSLYLEMERWDDAVAHLEAALANPEYRQPARAHHNLGWAHYNKGDFVGAREQYREVLRRFPQFCPSLRNLAHVDEAEGKAEDALERFRQAVECDPRDLKSLISLGILEARMDLVSDACQHLDTVKEADPYGELRDQAAEFLQMLDCDSVTKL